MNESEKKNRRRFDEEFKRSAVEMLESGVRSARQLGQELGVSEWSLSRWRKSYGGSGDGPAPGPCGGNRPTAPGAGGDQPTAGHFKKSLRYFRPGTVERFTLIETMKEKDFTLKELCATLEVSRSGYYTHGEKGEGRRRREDADLGERIRIAFHENRRTYGTRRLRVVLDRQGRACGRRRIARLMAEKGLRALRKGRYRPRTTDSRHAYPIAPNRLLPGTTETSCVAPEQTWVADITYLPTGEGWHYLAAEMNLGSRRIVGWKTGSTMESALVESAFRRAAFSYSSLPKLHHSDPGSQYAAGSFRSLLHSHSVTPSMSRRANCYDNAAMESFWSTLKTECFHAGPPPTRAEADQLLFDYIESFYNSRRLHSSLGYQSPAEYENSLCNLINKNN